MSTFNKDSYAGLVFERLRALSLVPLIFYWQLDYVVLLVLLYFCRSWRRSLLNRRSCFSQLRAEEERFWSTRPHPEVPGSFWSLKIKQHINGPNNHYCFCLCSTTEPFSPEALSERGREQMRQRWESLRLELKTKLQLLQKTLEQDYSQPVACCFRMVFLKVW